MLHPILRPILQPILQPVVGARPRGGVPTQVAAPTFSPSADEYGPTQNVTLSTSTVGASIYYTTNGDTPTALSTLYTVPIEVAATTTIKAIAIDGVLIDSAVSTGVFTINGAVATPTFSPVAGTYGVAQDVTISTATSGASLFYTTNGDTPTTGSTPYTAPVNVPATATLKAIGVKAGWIDSAVGAAAYTIGTAYMTATGGTVTTDGNFKVHTFNSSGTFEVTSGSGDVEYLVVAGGGGGARGGGGAGGFRTNGAYDFPLTVGTYSVTVGAGGADATSGSDSVFDTITAVGGGAGGLAGNNGSNGGSGGGAGAHVGDKLGGTGTASQGNAGGKNNTVNGEWADPFCSGGGGGAGAAGVHGDGAGVSGNGGVGLSSSISGASVTYAGGGGGSQFTNGGTPGSGGAGGGGSGTNAATGQAGTANTGGGGGGSNQGQNGGAGGSGVVIVRYQFQ